jgi:hypothetical protein
MSERTAQGEVLQDVEISPAAAAVLEFTSDTGEPKRPGELTYITSKDAYVWAGLAAFLAEHPGVDIENRFRDVDIVAAIYRAVSAHPKNLSEPNIPNVTYNNYNVSFDISDISIRNTFRRMNVLFNSVSNEILGVAFAAAPMGDVDPQMVSQYISNGYNELRDAGLISDPVIETTLALAILSFVPFSIVQRTKNGRVVYRKIQAGLWKYERARRSGGETQTNLTFKAARIAKAIKVGLIAAYHEATKGEGEEPTEAADHEATKDGK